MSEPVIIKDAIASMESVMRPEVVERVNREVSEELAKMPLAAQTSEPLETQSHESYLAETVRQDGTYGLMPPDSAKGEENELELIYRIRGGLSYLDSAGHSITYTHPRLSDMEAATLLTTRRPSAEPHLPWRDSLELALAENAKLTARAESAEVEAASMRRHRDDAETAYWQEHEKLIKAEAKLAALKASGEQAPCFADRPMHEEEKCQNYECEYFNPEHDQNCSGATESEGPTAETCQEWRVPCRYVQRLRKAPGAEPVALRARVIKEVVAIFDKHASFNPHGDGNNAIIICSDELRAEIATLAAQDAPLEDGDTK